MSTKKRRDARRKRRRRRRNNKSWSESKDGKKRKSGSSNKRRQDERKRRSGRKGLNRKDNVKRKSGRRSKWKTRNEGGKHGNVNGKNGDGRSRRQGSDASGNIPFHDPNCSGTCLRIQNQLGSTNRVSSCPRATFSPFSSGSEFVIHRQTHESDNYSKIWSRLTFPHVQQGTLASR